MWKIGEMNQIFLGALSAIVIPLSACIRSSYRDLHDELTGDTGDTFGWLSPDFDGWWFGTCFIFPYPIGSMYAIYGNIYHQYTPNVSIYTIHGSYGYWNKSSQLTNSIIFQRAFCGPHQPVMHNLAKS